MASITTQNKEMVGGTRQYIIDTARGLFSEQGYLGVSIRDIAQKLNITKAALYYHFTGKEEIYKEVLEGTFRDLNSVIQDALEEETTNKKIHKLIEGYLNFGLREKNLIKIMVAELSPNTSTLNKIAIELREKIANQIEPLIKEFFTRKNTVNGVNPRLLTLMLMGMMDGLLLEYSMLGSEINPGLMASQITAVLSLE